MEGWVDGWQDGCVTGWAWSPEARLVIEVMAGDEVVATGIADRYRGDLVPLGKGDGLCGFKIGVPARAEAAVLHVRVANGPVLPGERLVLDAAARAAEAPTALPVDINGPGGLVGLVERCGPDVLSGWATRGDAPCVQTAFEIVADGAVVGSFTADWWRGDLAEGRQGDGRWGFAAAFPPSLRNGTLRDFDIRLPGGGSVLAAPLRVEFPAHERPAVPLRGQDEDAGRSTRVRAPRNDAPDDVMFSVVVVFYDMRREAERTLTSLTRAYQRGIGNLRYEVLCVDNGSPEPLEAEWVAGFGPEFRLLRPSVVSPSPVLAINEAARAAQGRYICVMIDGAHVLTPGVLREVWDALDEAPEAVVGLRQWFVGGDQRWLAHVGYRRAQEDILFDRIHWPQDGYGLFSIGGPVYENGNAWMGSMNESNFLVVPRPVWQRIGGMDERFDTPGGGFANLDLFSRAAAASPEPVVALVGEASFHQFHGGTTTNVIDDEKDRRVRAYLQTYEQMTQRRFSEVANMDLRLRGQIHIDRATRSRQRPHSPARLGVTDKVRPAVLPVHFDDQAVEYLDAVYAESGLAAATTWRGAGVGVAPADLLALQDILCAQRPDAVVLVNAAPGLVKFVADLARLQATPCRLVAAGTTASAGGLPEGTIVVQGAAGDEAARAAVARALGTAERVTVLFAPDAGDHLPLAALRGYAALVSIRGYLVFLGTALGQPWLGYSINWYKKTVETLVAEGHFAVDLSRTRQLVSLCPHGFLQRIGPVVSFSQDIFS